MNKRVLPGIALLAIGAYFGFVVALANFNGITTSAYNFTLATRVFAPNPTYLARTSTVDPRILQLAAKITF